MRLFVAGALALCAFLLSVHPLPASAQVFSPCGVVDALDYPIDISDTLERGYDDFGILRPRFGGNHVGIDIGFDRWGDPVHAVARGRVTLSNIEEWDTEKGVVIVEHVFPDGSIVYSLYGHVEQGDSAMLPPVGTCVERGDVVALIGWPSRGKPHLHYELRSMMPAEGGPGYVAGNPLLEGWYHPLEFTELWRTRLQPGFVDVRTYPSSPTEPPVLLDDGSIALALSDQLVSFIDGVERWRISLGEVATGLTGLPGGRIAALARGGQVFTLQNGRFVGAWPVEALEASPVVAAGSSGESLVFATAGGGLAAYSAAGDPLWSVPALAGDEDATRVIGFAASGADVVLVVRGADGPVLRLVRDGALVLDWPLADPALAAVSPAGGWLVVNGPAIERLTDSGTVPFAELPAAPGRGSRLTADGFGGVYLLAAGTRATLTAYDPAGTERWETSVPNGRAGLSPLLAVGGGCLLYALDADGALRAYRTADGELAAERLLYPGGNQSGSPRSRLLLVTTDDALTVSAGFLSVMRFDGLALPGDQAACRPG